MAMSANFRRSAAPLITTIQKRFSEDLAMENDFLRQENKILRSKLGKQVPLTEADRRTLVRYGLSIKERLAEVMTIARPDMHRKSRLEPNKFLHSTRSIRWRNGWS
jgi:hypothetical protein